MSHLADEETAKFKERTPRSSEVFAKAKLLTPYGVHSNYRYTEPYPLYCSRGKGSRVWDVDGNEYLDFCMAFGALASGHAHPALVRAVEERVRNGSILGFESEDSPRLGSLMTKRFNLDMVRFSSTGLEATLHATRLARAYTKRRKILKFEGCYHGSHDTLLVSVKPTAEKSGTKRVPNQVPASQGIPDEVVKNTLVAQFNDLGSVEDVMSEHGESVAAVILEPIAMNMGFIAPEPGFLEGLRKQCSENGSVLIFDEVKTSGKFYHGAESKFGVKPDMKVLGKAIAGGFPLSVIGGRKEIMETITPGVVAHAGTFNSNPVAVTAGITTLGEILTENAMGTAAKMGNDLGKAYTDLVQDAGIEAKVQWDGMSGTIHFNANKVRNWRDFLKCNLGRWWSFYLSMLNHGVIPMATGPDEQWTVSVQHTEEDVTKHVEIFKVVVSKLKEAGFEMPMVEAL